MRREGEKKKDSPEAAHRFLHTEYSRRVLSLLSLRESGEKNRWRRRDKVDRYKLDRANGLSEVSISLARGGALPTWENIAGANTCVTNWRYSLRRNETEWRTRRLSERKEDRVTSRWENVGSAATTVAFFEIERYFRSPAARSIGNNPDGANDQSAKRLSSSL